MSRNNIFAAGIACILDCKPFELIDGVIGPLFAKCV
ncbi:hypothetical protein QOZ92_001552 [Paeniclostridium ghonii]|uniref:Uncharacterized protein n=1 Tax=Paraclostridium ghonii TaxID=29358 RepID=A0ABU0MZU4_9FIRM|nr:hypothetical protein [Paeniclostridium ghonii]